MKCFNCGKECKKYICSECRSEEILKKVFNDIKYYDKGIRENIYLAEYASGLTERYAERDIIPEILGYFDFSISEFYYCKYYGMRGDIRFENTALSYIESHDINEMKTQSVIYDLLNYYIPNDFIKPQKWCEIIEKSDDFCIELYCIVAKFYAMIAEYDKSDAIVEKAIKLCDSADGSRLSFYTVENMKEKLEKQKADTERYRTKKPYWPTTEERRRMVAMFYDEKGIKYPRIENKPEKIKESEFEPIVECFEVPANYTAFWCAEAFSIATSKSIYQIAAAKVNEGKITDTFQMYIRPWDGAAVRKSTANMAGISPEVLESAEDVDQVMSKFFDFVGDDVLVSTEALSSQAILISRAARYSGMNKIINEFFDILDMAEEVAQAEFENKDREFLLKKFDIAEGQDALGKAKANAFLFEALAHYGE